MLASKNSPGALENDWMPEKEGDGPESPENYLQRAKEGQADFYNTAATQQQRNKPIAPTPENQKKYHNLGQPAAAPATAATQTQKPGGSG